MEQNTGFANRPELGEPLNDNERDRLQAILEGFPASNAMDVEQMDGYFAALICGPEAVSPNRYLGELWGGGPPPFYTAGEFEEFLDLAMRHWNFIAHSLGSRDCFFEPWLVLDPGDETPRGNRWAEGFMQATRACYEIWKPIYADEDKFTLLMPMMALAHENDPDLKMRTWTEPPNQELREKLLIGLSVMTQKLYDSSRSQSTQARAGNRGFRASAKNGRNDPCPCGSGKKYKRCCGGVTVH